MSDDLNMDLDTKEEKTSPKFELDLQESSYSSNKSNNDFETTKSVTNRISNTQIPSSKYVLKDKTHELKAIFNSVNLETKNQLTNNSINQNSNILTTDPNTYSETNKLLPRKKRISQFKMIQKTKYKIFEPNLPYTKKIDEENETGRERRDIYGNLINKKNKRKIKISFADELKEEKPLVSVIDIESFKKYNYIFGMPNEEAINKNIRTNCQCCSVF